jgi:hypothetical protein
LDPLPPPQTHVTRRRVTAGPQLSVDFRRIALVPLVAGVAAVALIVGQRTDGQADPAVPATQLGQETPVQTGPPNPWATGDAAVARYLTEQGASCR